MTAPLRLAFGLGLALLVAALVGMDPLLSSHLPERLWRMTGMETSPLKLVPVLAVLALLALPLLPHLVRLPDFAVSATGALFLAAQLNGFGVGPFDVFDVVLGVVFLVWIARKALDETRPIALPPLIMLAGGLVLVSVLHLAVENPVRWFIGTFGIARATLVAFLVIDLIRDRPTMERALDALLWLAVASAVVGIVQFSLSWFGVLNFTLINPPESAFKPTPVGFVMRASAFCITAQHFSSFLVYALPVAFWRLSNGWAARHWAAILLLLGGVLVSWNFGAMIAAALIGAAFPFVRWPRLAVHFAMALAAAAVLAWFTGFWELLYDLSFGDAGVAKGVSQRHTLFGLGIEKIARNPLVGTGPQGFAAYDGNFWGRPVHNAFGQVTTELGVAGLLLLAGAYAWLIGKLALALAAPGAARGQTIVVFLMLLAALQLAQSEPNMDHTNTWIVLGLAQAILLVRALDQH